MAATGVTYGPTGDQEIDGLLSGEKWNTLDLTYSFPSVRADYEANYSDPAVKTVHQLTPAQQAMVATALAQVESLTQLSFTNVTGTATYPDIRYALSSAPDPAYTYYPANVATDPEGGDSFYNNGQGDFSVLTPGSYGYMTFLHESGHSLGLKHGHEVQSPFPALPSNLDSLEFSVMTYRAYIGGPVKGAFHNEAYGFPQSYMMLDIQALQTLYGANYSFNDSNTTYSFSPASGQEFIDGVAQPAPGADRIFLTIWDGGGNDTYDFSNYRTNLVVNLNPGGWTTTAHAQLADLSGDGVHLARGNIANALEFQGNPASLIENAIGGSGSDKIIGNVAANDLFGRAGADTLNGLQGNDVLVGGAGADRLIGGAGADVFLFNSKVESRLAAHDTILDFHRAQGDVIDLAPIDANAHLAGNQAFSFIGARQFSHHPGQLRDAGGFVQGDINGDGRADFEIHVNGHLHPHDFIL